MGCCKGLVPPLPFDGRILMPVDPNEPVESFLVLNVEGLPEFKSADTLGWAVQFCHTMDAPTISPNRS